MRGIAVFSHIYVCSEYNTYDYKVKNTITDKHPVSFFAFDPLLTQNPKKAGRAGRKQWKIRRVNGGKKHKSEPFRLRFVLETTYGPEGRGFESLTAYQKSSKSSDFEDFCFS